MKGRKEAAGMVSEKAEGYASLSGLGFMLLRCPGMDSKWMVISAGIVSARFVL